MEQIHSQYLLKAFQLLHREDARRVIGHLFTIQGKGNEFGFEHLEDFRYLWNIQGGGIKYDWICGSEAQEEAVRGIRVNGRLSE